MVSFASIDPSFWKRIGNELFAVNSNSLSTLWVLKSCFYGAAISLHRATDQMISIHLVDININIGVVYETVFSIQQQTLFKDIRTFVSSNMGNWL